jgi:hypothetical protein
MRGPVTRHEAQVRGQPAGQRHGVGDPAHQRQPDPGAADADQADPLARPVAEPAPQRRPVGQLGGVEAGHVPGEVEVLVRPHTDRGQPRPELVRNDIVRVADEHRPVAQRPQPGPLLEHLGVVVGSQRRLPVAAGRHRQPADEVGQPGVRSGLQLRVLVQEVVDVTGLVADHQVVPALGDDVVEDHEVRDEDLVHPADGAERVQVVLAALVLETGRLAGQVRRGRWMVSLRSASTLVTGSWASQSICRSGCSPRSSSAIATSRRAWPRPIGEDR